MNVTAFLTKEGKTATDALIVKGRYHHERFFCFTFGHAKQPRNPLAIERYFGLKPTLSFGDPHQYTQSRDIQTLRQAEKNDNNATIGLKSVSLFMPEPVNGQISVISNFHLFGHTTHLCCTN